MNTVTTAPTSAASASTTLGPTDTFFRRHIPHTAGETTEMLAACGYGSMAEFLTASVPSTIRLARGIEIDDPTRTGTHAERGEAETLAALKAMAGKNEIWRSYLGMGYHDTITPPVIQIGRAHV